jgi:hypothetical protein
MAARSNRPCQSPSVTPCLLGAAMEQRQPHSAPYHLAQFEVQTGAGRFPAVFEFGGYGLRVPALSPAGIQAAT